MSAQPLLLTAATPIVEPWLPFREALTLCDRSLQWFWLEVKAGNIRVRDTERIQRNGRPEREVAVFSLPVAAQQRWQREQAKAAEVAPVQPSLFAAPQLVRPTAPRVRVAPAQTSEVERKRLVLEPILAFRDDAHARHIYSQSLQLTDGTPVNSLNKMVAYVIAQQKAAGVTLTRRTIQRWLAAHKTEGQAGLQRKRRTDAGQSRWFQQHPKAAQLVAHLYLGDGIYPGLSAQACYDALEEQAEIAGVTADDLPHPDTVRHFLNSAPKSLVVYARKGKEEFAGRMMPYLSRGYTEYANQIWVSDTMLADVEVMNDGAIPGAKLGAPVRLQLTAIIDYRSRYVVGYTWCWTGSSVSIANALRRAVIAHGPCEHWYCDNGKDYRKVAKGAVPAYMLPESDEALEWVAREMAQIERTGILARLGVKVTHCIVRHPQSKHVERFFRTLHEQFCKLWPTYTGGKPGLRPDNTAALMTVHRRALAAGDLTRSHHPLASEFIAKFEAWLDRYHNHDHSGEGMDGRTPAEVFAQERNPNQKPAPSREDLAWLLWDHKTVTVRECQVVLNKVQYVPADDVAAHLMFLRNETKVVIAYDPLDQDEIAVLDESNRLLTFLQRKVLARMAPEDAETQRQIAAMQQMRGHLRQGVKATHLAIVKGAKQLGVRHPLELLGDGLAPTTTSVPQQIAADVESGRITPRKPQPVEPVAPSRLSTNQIIERHKARRSQQK